MKKRMQKMITALITIVRYIFYLCYVEIKNIDNLDVWLISERGDEARDNGYCLYRWLKRYHPEIKVKYVISKKSPDITKIDEKDIVEYRSKDHYLLFLTSGCLISTHIMGCSPDRATFWRLDKCNLAKYKGKKVFLQHGITKDYMDFMSKKVAGLDLFICGAKPEYDFITTRFGYSKEEAKLTGFARFDSLEAENDGYILIMPTWRKWLPYLKDIEKSNYIIHWQNFLNNEKLKQYLKKANKKVIFYPHYEMQPYLKYFKINNDKVTVATFEKYDVQNLLKGCELLITDYSSVFFDCAYMGKRIYYYQFDYDEYRAKHYSEGYFDYKKMGFGPVLYDEDSIVNAIVSNDYDVALYKSRANRFFMAKDKNNAKRIYDEIVKTVEKDSKRWKK